MPSVKACLPMIRVPTLVILRVDYEIEGASPDVRFTPESGH